MHDVSVSTEDGLAVNDFLQHIHLERRRLIIAGYLAYFAGFILHAHLIMTVFGLPFPVFTGLVYLGSVVLAGVVTTYFLPKIRWLIDCIAVSRLCFAFCIVGLQGQEFAASPMLSALIVVGGAIFIHRLGGQLNKISQSTYSQGSVTGLVERVRIILDWIDNKAERDVRAHTSKTSPLSANSWPKTV